MWQHQRLILLRVSELMAAGRREMAMVLRIYVYIYSTTQTWNQLELYWIHQ